MTEAQSFLLNSTDDELIRLELSRVFALDAHLHDALEALSRHDYAGFDQAMTSFRNLQQRDGAEDSNSASANQ